ncbi:MAG TPA: hypothetical protein VIM16_04500 [Mucilaginibacter sp.]|jgi:hypothetical protein
MKKRKSFWLSYDLGLKGDYEGLFSFLDNVSAIECVDNLAYFAYECDTNIHYHTQVQELLQKNVNIDINKDRFYLIWKEDNGDIGGKFLFGGRKRSPWEGFGKMIAENESDIAE